MNRKERRAAQKHSQRATKASIPGPLPPAPGRDLFAAAVQTLRGGQSSEAERLCREAIRLDPNFFDATHLLGFIALQSGRAGTAIEVLGQAAAINPQSPECRFHLALAFHRDRQLDAAIAQFTQATALKPDFTAAHVNLGNVLMQQGKIELAKTSYQRALELDAASPDPHLNLGNVCMRLDQKAEAEAHYRRAVALKPDHAGAHINLGAVLMAQARVAEAIDCLRRAAALRPEAAETHRHLADALVQNGELAAAEAAYRQALGLQPNAMEARHGLANLLMDQGALEPAVAEFERCLALQPDHPQVRNNLGIALAGMGRLAEAEAQYRAALALKPDLVDVYRNLGRLILARGDAAAALQLARRALATEETIELRAFFVDCAKKLSVAPTDPEFRVLVARALSEGWSRPSELSGLAAELFGLTDLGKSSLERAARAWPRYPTAFELFGEGGLALIGADGLLRALLVSAPVRMIEIERFLTAARHALLQDANAFEPARQVEPPALEFYCALARQCFINEYVFSLADDEWRQAAALRDRLDAALAVGAPIPVLWPVAVAAYVPLHALAQAPALLKAAWPDPIRNLLRQQVEEPLQERDMRGSIAALTPIDDPVSLAVRRQYEEMPYPRWIKTTPIGKPVSVDWYLRNRFPGATFRSLGKRQGLDILIAGCGTGQHSIETAQRFVGAKVLAIDLSLSSLSYATRMTQALGLSNIEYRHGDILKLGKLDRSFDVIEASGVLHHLRDPAAGWRILLSMLRPNGFMNIGLYSALARADVRAARAFIAERRHGESADGIRGCRQEMMAAAEGTPLRNVAKYPDFFTTSECRDLLFHVQEHQLSIPQIKVFLAENNLAFIGFACEADADYRRRFPRESALSDLDNWHVFETENPMTFVGMYQFWVQKL